MADTSSTGNDSATKVAFIAMHEPALTPGDYTIKATQTVTTATLPVAQGQTFSCQRRFTVQGPRFVLQPTDVKAVFPADGSLADHSAALPHIVLDRSTLPWERSADQAGAVLPWLALLLFDDAEKPDPQIITLSSATPPGVQFPVLTLETQDRPQDQVTIIDVPWGLLNDLLPKGVDLTLLAHVRRPLDSSGAPSGDETAVVIANRLPLGGGASTVHLVSLEGRYGNGQFAPQPNSDDTLVRLVSLKSWSFTCTDPSQNFQRLLENVNRDPQTPRLPECSDTIANSYLALGSAALPHYLRQGGETVSWYHGPLAPAKVNAELAGSVRAADALVRYNTSTGMFDVSYAAAWELGRMLALQSKAFSTSLYSWKRASVQWLRSQEQRLLHPHLQIAVPAGAPATPQDVCDWFDDLRELRGVPFDYLVPDERMLPVESLRFFCVDHYWIDCLLDGAFGVGRVSDREQQSEGQFVADPTGGDAEAMTGFLLRSDVVGGWPGLLVDAFDATGKALDRLRLDRLSASVMIGVFRGEAARFSFHLQPDLMHFGFDVNTSGGTNTGSTPSFSKALRVAEGAKPQTLQTLPWRTLATQHPGGRVLDIAALAAAINDLIKLPVFNSAHFAYQMIEGSPQVEYVLKPTVAAGP
jgi:hypothetical protein